MDGHIPENIVHASLLTYSKRLKLLVLYDYDVNPLPDFCRQIQSPSNNVNSHTFS